ncbi:hypothetical protein Tco_1580917 [Tanacetum coccineum]
MADDQPRGRQGRQGGYARGQPHQGAGVNEEEHHPNRVNRPDREITARPGRYNSSQNLGMKVDIPDFEGKSHPDEFIGLVIYR